MHTSDYQVPIARYCLDGPAAQEYNGLEADQQSLVLLLLVFSLSCKSRFRARASQAGV
jgi:hypothetical protein